MIDIKIKQDCCGCYACTNICPKDCIEMEIDNEGFWYPVVDKSKCINCSLCEKVCPELENPAREDFKSIAYACKNKDIDIRMSSSSGGVFTSLCEYVISNTGVVFGVAFDDNFKVKHMKAENLEECKKFRGSKYVQSQVGNTYSECRKYLNEGRLVLFSGTQCQIKGLNLFLRKKYDNLISVDIVCHGVPSPKVFDLYKNNLEKKYNSKVSQISFRDKSKSWKLYNYKTDFENGKDDTILFTKNIYSKGFLNNLYLRPSCYSCKAKDFLGNADITLGDYWGIQNIHKEFDDDKGTSLVIVNTQKGQNYLNDITESIEIIDTDLDFGIKNNSCIVRPVKYNEKRKNFFDELNENNLEEMIIKYTKVPMHIEFKNKARGVLGKIKRKLLK